MQYLKLSKTEIFRRGETIGHFSNEKYLEKGLGCFWKRQPDYLWHALQFAGITARDTTKRLLLVQEPFFLDKPEYIYRVVNPAHLVKELWHEQTESGILIPKILEIDVDGSVFKSKINWDKNTIKKLVEENPFLLSRKIS